MARAINDSTTALVINANVLFEYGPGLVQLYTQAQFRAVLPEIGFGVVRSFNCPSTDNRINFHWDVFLRQRYVPQSFLQADEKPSDAAVAACYPLDENRLSDSDESLRYVFMTQREAEVNLDAIVSNSEILSFQVLAEKNKVLKRPKNRLRIVGQMSDPQNFIYGNTVLSALRYELNASRFEQAAAAAYGALSDSGVVMDKEVFYNAFVATRALGEEKSRHISALLKAAQYGSIAQIVEACHQPKTDGKF